MQPVVVASAEYRRILMPTVYCADIEGDDLLQGITKVWCGSFAELDDNRQVSRLFTETSYEGIGELFATQITS